ncbi:hypothetical protein EI42_04959 [Thermosporothrix hazakensis]|jgi:hypothetical protein|uniref:Uncharacterized protein n=1 Tax=Thermosporothrix hazakensis TaxID=644383 RepID=A0A326U0D1_THEHA|nr:hypothetical protein [Thermosporothrix hazakensis]PZW23576.1 hypothetical protein EI42_04959 [Thermosporothrix hazakensis]GCE51057.1 hypothetical protein KTH_59260 [Thermosporothrix hazakensis]
MLNEHLESSCVQKTFDRGYATELALFLGLSRWKFSLAAQCQAYTPSAPTAADQLRSEHAEVAIAQLLRLITLHVEALEYASQPHHPYIMELGRSLGFPMVETVGFTLDAGEASWFRFFGAWTGDPIQHGLLVSRIHALAIEAITEQIGLHQRELAAEMAQLAAFSSDYRQAFRRKESELRRLKKRVHELEAERKAPSSPHAAGS